MPLSTRLQLEAPTGTGYITSLGGLRKLGAGLLDPLVKLARKVTGRITPERRVKDAGQGDYRLYRRGQEGAVRLNIVARLASPRPAAGDAAAAPDPAAVAPQPAAAQDPAAAPRQGAAVPAQPAAKDFAASFAKARSEITALATDLAELRAKAEAAGIASKSGRRLDTQRRLKEVAVEQAIMRQLAALRPGSEVAASGNLSAEKRAEARSFLFQQLVAVHLPGVADHLARLEAVPQTEDGTNGLIQGLAEETGQRVDQLLLRNLPDLWTEDLRDVDADAVRDGFHGGLLADVMEGLDRLDAAGLLKPALLRRLADVGPMRAWAGGAAETPRQALDRLDAAFAFRDMLNGLVSGNRVTINFLLGGDSRLDEGALRLKLKMNEGKPGFDEEAVRLQHALDTAKRGLQELLTARQESWGKARPGDDAMGRYRRDKVDTVINEGGSDQIRVDSRLVQALRNAASKGERTTVRADADAGRDVNMLIANVMLLQKRLDAKQGVDEVRALETAKADALAKVLAEAKSHAGDKRLGGLPSDDEQQVFRRLGGGTMGENLRAIQRALRLDAELAFDERGSADTDAGERTAALHQELGTELKKELQWLGRMFDGKAPAIEDLRPYAGLATAVAAYEQADKALSEAKGRARADLDLGLDEKDLLAMGFGRDEVATLMADLETELHDTVGGIAAQGLRNSQDVKQVNDSINKIVGRLLGKGMAQDTLGQLGAGFSEGRATLFLDLAFRGVSGKDGVGADDDGVKAAFEDQAGAYLRDADGAESADVAQTVDETSASHGEIMLGIAEEAARLGRLDEAQKAAREKLGTLAGDLHLKVDPKDPKGFELAKVLLAAVQTDKSLRYLEGLRHPNDQVRAAIDEFRQKLDKDLAVLRKLDPTTMRGSVFFGNGPATRSELRRFATSRRLDVARQIVTIRSIPGQKAAIMRGIENRAAAADDILAARRDLMGASHGVLRTAIRAAILEVRATNGTAVKDFEPADVRDRIEARLRSWGIDPARYAPEIGEAIHGTFDAAAVERWIEDAKVEVGDTAFRKAVDPSKATRARRFLKRVVAFDNQKADYVTRRTVLDTVKTMKVGDKIYVAQGDTGTLYTGRIPVEKTGTIRVSATIVAGERKLFEIQKTEDGLELFFKAGLQGSGTAGVYASLFQVADAGVTGTVSGNRLAGAGLRFTDEAALEDFLQTLLDGGPVSPSAWSKAAEAARVTDRTLKLMAGVELFASTSALADKLGWARDFLELTTDALGGEDAQLFAGLEASADMSREARWIEEENAERRVIEKETVYEVGARFRVGAYAILPTTGDFIIDHQLSENTSIKRDAHDPFTANFYTPFAAGGEIKRTIGVTRRLAYRRDGLLDDAGNEITKTYTAQGAVSASGLSLLGPSFTRSETAAGATDSLLQALKDDRTGFRSEVTALLAAAGTGDQVAVTYALRDDIRMVIDDNLKEAGRLHRSAAAARARGDEAAARQFEKAADAREGMAKRLHKEESSYTASEVQLVKNSGVSKDLRVLGLRTLRWGRYSEGGVERPALTLAVPGGPAERVESADL